LTQKTPFRTQIFFVGPGRYRDDYHSISHAVKTKIRPNYKGDTIDTKSGPYTYVGGSKVLDLGFVSPQNKKKLPTTVLTTSINLASTQTSKGTPVGSSTESINFSFNKGHSSSEIPGKRKSHNRTSSLSVQSSAQTVHTVQTSVGRRTPLDRALTSTNPLLTDLSGKKMTEGPRVSYNQKQKNDDVYNSYLELQLSSELRSLKQDLENFQKRKTVAASGETSKLCSRSGSIHIGSLINAMEQAATIAPPIRIKEDIKKRNNTEEEEGEVIELYKKPERVPECSEEEEREEDTIGTEIPEEGKELIYYKEAARAQKNEKSKVLKDNVNYAQYFKSLEGSLHYDDSASYEAKKTVQKPQHVETYTMKEQVKEVFISKAREQKVEKTTTGNRLGGIKKRTLSGTKEIFGLKPPGPGGYYTHNLSYGITGSKGKSSLYGLRKI